MVHSSTPPTVGRQEPCAKLLEVADCIAYVAHRSMAAGWELNDRRFKSLQEVVAPEVVRFGIAPDGGWGFNILNDSV